MSQQQYEQQGAAQEWAEALEQKHPSLKSWPGKEPMNVYKAINRIQLALSKEGISKGRKNTQQGYNFRGIDDVYNVLSPLLAEHGLCILPRMLSRICDERQTKSGSTLFYVTVEAEFDFVSADDGSRHVVKTFGEAMDSGDKATNKAMSAAYKYAAFQAFAIPTEGDNDADAVTPPPSVRAPVRDGIGDDLPDNIKSYLKDLADRCTALVLSNRADEAYWIIKGEALEPDQETWLANNMDAKTRAAIKAAGQKAKQA